MCERSRRWLLSGPCWAIVASVALMLAVLIGILQ